jgi:cytoskeletal protein CcmA (bactofilin family)
MAGHAVLAYDAGHMAQDSTPPHDERRVTAWVGKALRIEGRIVSTEHLTIDGDVDGTIEVGDHSLIIGPGATVKADLRGKTITVSGTVTGDLTATETVVLQPAAIINGDISTPRLSMADGAVVRGHVEARGEKKPGA